MMAAMEREADEHLRDLAEVDASIAQDEAGAAGLSSQFVMVEAYMFMQGTGDADYIDVLINQLENGSDGDDMALGGVPHQELNAAGTSFLTLLSALCSAKGSYRSRGGRSAFSAHAERRGLCVRLLI